MRRDHIDALGNLQAGRICIHHQRGDAARARCLTGAHKHHIEVGNAAVRDPGFFAVDDIVVAVQAGGAGHGGHVRSGIGLGQRKGRNRLAPCDPAQVARLLRLRARQADCARAQPLHCKRKVGQAVVARQGFADQADGAGVDLGGRAAMRLASHCMAQPARLAQRLHQRAAIAVGVTAVHMGHMPGGPGIERLRQLGVARLKKRPLQVTGVGHVSSPGIAAFAWPQRPRRRA